MTSHASLPLDKAPRRIAGMFDAIASRYDLLNSLLSAGLDRSWRKRAVRALKLRSDDVAIDLCTGTGDLALAMVREGGAGRVIGVDFAGEMLRRGWAKVQSAGLDRRIALFQGDAMDTPVGSETAAGVAIAFGIRNVAEPSAALREAHRVLKPGGRLVILEFGYPSFAPIKAIYLAYFTFVLPLVGRMVSGHDSAYTYLPASVGTFFAPDVFCGLLQDAGFVQLKATKLTAGVVCLYEAVKPNI